MTVAIVIGLCIAGWAALAARQRWYDREATLGLMSERWLAELRAHERHRP